MDIFLTILGALIGWGVSHAYYLKALNDVKADAENDEEWKSWFYAESRASETSNILGRCAIKPRSAGESKR